jgi:aldehyde dehydrogenase (NAD+)
MSSGSQLSPVVGAIAAGNCVLIKPSEMSTAVEKVLTDHLPSYVDSDCIKIVTGGIGITTEILRLRWDKIFFTGSPRVGKIVMKAAAEHLTPVSLELGGKSPTIIDESVGDLDLAAQRVMWGKCCNAGQTCIAPDYVFCHEKVRWMQLTCAVAD